MESFTINIPEQDRFTDEELLRFSEAIKEPRIGQILLQGFEMDLGKLK
jgi:hypothetical protein